MADTPSFTVDSIGIANKTPAFLFKLQEQVIYPHGLTPILLDDKEKCSAVDGALAGDRLLAIFNELPDEEDFASLSFKVNLASFVVQERKYSVLGTLVRIIKEMRFPDGSRRIVVRGVRRIVYSALEHDDEGRATVYYRNHLDMDTDTNSEDNAGRARSVAVMFQELSGMLPGLPDEINLAVINAPNPSRMCDVISDAMNFSYVEKLLLLTMINLKDRLKILSVLLNREIETSRLGMKIQGEVQEALSESQREYYLREQLKTIKKELGEETRNPDLVMLSKRFEENPLPDSVAETVKRELDRLELIPPNAPEYHISYNYITWLLDVPWEVETEDRLDCVEAEKILDADHYGLEDVKNRILEFLSVLQLRKNDTSRRAPILCLAGPPGVGKTSLGQSIAKAMNRKFIRVSFGGVRDEAEIRGHRRTYIGAMPGRIVQNLKRAGSCNPIFMLDEVDKLAHDFRGDPASALLEVLDPEQNFAFNDNYIELPLDLSKVFFIATANVLDDIPGPLRDRMEIIQIPGYTSFEKREIAKRYLVRRQIKAAGFKQRDITFQMSAIDEIIDYYTMESGVRSLDRVVGQVCRRLARKVVNGKLSVDSPVKVDSAMVRDLLGAHKFIREQCDKISAPGCATGLAWTAVGGTTLPIETLMIPSGKGELKLTGSLGKVMQESAAAAFSLVRSSAAEWGIDPELFTKNDFHIHVPDGATPKDGPSAGITLTMALLSLLRRRPLRPKLAMTGEITLQGKVTAVGGIREKLVGALRADIREVMIPEENRKDFIELPDNIKSKITVHFISDYHSAATVAFISEQEHEVANQ